MFSQHRPKLAIPYLKAAVALNPHVGWYWLDLASAYQSIGAIEEQTLSLEHAIDVDPTTPLVSWEVANSFLVQGDLPRAFRQFRLLLQTGTPRTLSILQTCWRATHNLDAMSDALPPKAEVYLEFLKLLIGERETSAAEKVWSQLAALKQPFDPQLAMPYLDYLIAQREVSPAQQAWKDLAQVNPSFLPYLPSVNFVVNGDFESKIMNGGFDWRHESKPHVTLALDAQEFHDGNRSLSVVFDGDAGSDTGVSQSIVISPDVHYAFTAYVKTEDISAAEGPQFVISDAYTRRPLLLTEELFGTYAWRQVSGEFRTDPTTQMVSLNILRAPRAGRITGKMWIDSVSIVRK